MYQGFRSSYDGEEILVRMDWWSEKLKGALGDTATDWEEGFDGFGGYLDTWLHGR